MRPGVVVGGTILLVLVGLGLMAPGIEGMSVMQIADQCVEMQMVISIWSIFDSGPADGCQTIATIQLGLYGLGAIGLIVLVAGMVTGRRR